jgi:hypothetical protein
MWYRKYKFQKKSDENNEQDKSDKYSEIIDTINKKQLS